MTASDYAMYRMVERVSCDIQQYVQCIYFYFGNIPKSLHESGRPNEYFQVKRT